MPTPRISPSQPLGPWAPRWAKWLGGAALCGALSACSTLDVPRAMNYPATGQQKARAVHHWDLLASDAAQRIAAKAALGGLEKQTFHLVPATSTPFNRAFGDLLLTRLVQQGLTLASSPVLDNTAGAYIRFDAQVVSHESWARNSSPLPITSLAAGLAVLRDSWMHIPTTASGAMAGLAAGLTVDLSTQLLSGSASGGPTRTELLVSTSLEMGQRFVSRTSDIYYIEPEDAKLFTPAPPPPPPPPPAPTKNWKVVGS
ncbi:MAG: hypothetical protein WBK26_14860 [Burkholderiaceae bacterium]